MLRVTHARISAALAPRILRGTREAAARPTAAAGPQSLARMLARFPSWLGSFYGREHPKNETVWHRWSVFVPVRCADGSFTIGDVWRRRRGVGWAYERYEETPDDWDAKIW
jgi:hypothetical protein